MKSRCQRPNDKRQLVSHRSLVPNDLQTGTGPQTRGLEPLLLTSTCIYKNNLRFTVNVPLGILNPNPPAHIVLFLCRWEITWHHPKIPNPILLIWASDASGIQQKVGQDMAVEVRGLVARNRSDESVCECVSVNKVLIHK